MVNFESPDRGSNFWDLPKPESRTVVIPSMVRLVSAIDVAKTILRRPSRSGIKAAYCFDGGSWPYKGWIANPFTLFFNKTSHFFISPFPGKNTKTQPPMKSNAYPTLGILGFFLTFVTLVACAQEKASPARTAEGTVNGAKITINYSSPAVKGRTIWGGFGAFGPGMARRSQ